MAFCPASVYRPSVDFFYFLCLNSNNFFFFFQFVLLGAVPFPTDVPRLREVGVGGVITLNEPYETLVPTSLYHVSGFPCSYTKVSFLRFVL